MVYNWQPGYYLCIAPEDSTDSLLKCICRTLYLQKTLKSWEVHWHLIGYNSKPGSTFTETLEGLNSLHAKGYTFYPLTESQYKMLYKV